MNELKWYTETKGWDKWDTLPYWAKYEILKNAATDWKIYSTFSKMYPEMAPTLLKLFQTECCRPASDPLIIPPYAFNVGVINALRVVFDDMWEKVQEHGRDGLIHGVANNGYSFIEEVYQHMRPSKITDSL